MIVIESPTSAVQLATLVHPATESESVIVTVPPPLGPTVVTAVAVTATVFAKLAVSVSPAVGVRTQGFVVPVQLPPDQPVKR